jgi:hypothetical protein
MTYGRQKHFIECNNGTQDPSARGNETLTRKAASQTGKHISTHQKEEKKWKEK